MILALPPSAFILACVSSLCMPSVLPFCLPQLPAFSCLLFFPVSVSSPCLSVCVSHFSCFTLTISHPMSVCSVLVLPRLVCLMVSSCVSLLFPHPLIILCVFSPLSFFACCWIVCICALVFLMVHVSGFLVFSFYVLVFYLLPRLSFVSLVFVVFCFCL